MKVSHAVDQLWALAPSEPPLFFRRNVAHLPEPARRYLEHAIAEGAPVASAVQLRMHGEIRLRRWIPFTAEEVLSWPHGMIWRATASLYGLPVRGFDRVVDGKAEMRWKLLRLVPMVLAAGDDVARSAAGRMAAEMIWLPSVLGRNGAQWSAIDDDHAEARLVVQGHETAVTIAVGESGRLASVRLRRWGNPDGGSFRSLDFGGVAEEERTFGGYTIPTRLRIGWYFGSPEFETKGEFFRVTVDAATFR